MKDAVKTRKQRLRDYGLLYKRMEKCQLDRCWYCGAHRETLDHCPPLVCLDHYDTDELRKQGVRFVLVPSCYSCNADLNAKKLWTPKERLVFLHQKLSGKIDRHFCAWTKDEVMALGYGLRKMVEARERQVTQWVVRLRGVEQSMLALDE